MLESNIGENENASNPIEIKSSWIVDMWPVNRHPVKNTKPLNNPANESKTPSMSTAINVAAVGGNAWKFVSFKATKPRKTAMG